MSSKILNLFPLSPPVDGAVDSLGLSAIVDGVLLFCGDLKYGSV